MSTALSAALVSMPVAIFVFGLTEPLLSLKREIDLYRLHRQAHVHGFEAEIFLHFKSGDRVQCNIDIPLTSR
jgi:hypothetical protein